MAQHHIGALVVLVALAAPAAQAQPTTGGGISVTAGGSIGANAGQNSGPWPAAGDNSAGNTLSTAQTLGVGPASAPAATGFGAPDAVVGPAAGAFPPPKPAPAASK